MVFDVKEPNFLPPNTQAESLAKCKGTGPSNNIAKPIIAPKKLEAAHPEQAHKITVQRNLFFFYFGDIIFYCLQ